MVLNKRGQSRTREYVSWRSIKDRVFNSNSKDYQKYGGAGLGMEPLWREDFGAFVDYIGFMPSNGKKYTVDRVDNTKGYFKGNVRWATDKEQSRNRLKSESNSSGVSGVSWIVKANNPKQKYLYAGASWNTLEGKRRTKLFPVHALGLLPAFKLACEYRAKMIEQLNTQGAGYSESHGK